MNEREELRRIVGNRWFDEDELVSAILAAGYHKGPRIPEPGSAEWEAMVDLAHDAANDARPRVSEDYATMAMIEAALRAALGIRR